MIHRPAGPIGFHLLGSTELSVWLGRANDGDDLRARLTQLTEAIGPAPATAVVAPPPRLDRTSFLQIVSSTIQAHVELFAIAPMVWRNRHGPLLTRESRLVLPRLVDAGSDLEAAIGSATVLARSGLLAVVVPSSEVFRARRFVGAALRTRAIFAEEHDADGPVQAR